MVDIYNKKTLLKTLLIKVKKLEKCEVYSTLYIFLFRLK